MKAVILAAGEGRRLEPLTNHRPKPMLPVANQPILEHVIEAVSGAGIEEIVLVVGYKRERIQTHFGNGQDYGVDISYAVQEHQLGTGHAVLEAEADVEDQFLVLNGDRIIESKLVSEVAQRLRDEGGPVVSVTRVSEARNYGVVELVDERVTNIHEKPTDYESTSNLINAGVYGFERSIFDVIRETNSQGAGEVELTTALNSIAKKDALTAVQYRGQWLDVSYPWDLLTVTGSLVEGDGQDHDRTGASVANDIAIGKDVRIGSNSTVRSRVALGANVSIGANVVLSNTVVLPDATIADGAVLRDAIVGENTVVGPNTTIVGGESKIVVDDEVHRDVRLGGVIGDNSRVGGGVTVAPGTIVGENARIGTGVTIDDRVPPNTEVRRG
ncbi:N-acetylglucosamine-1-phosphate uridyltransferase [Halanaeroarchaeum sp. HSR-CO]|uniref:sugar phosphate nucleotidyltransferase n=1 Tax=Halanaeroarchaeum sp. HSR-CO TaxID=2866382 RepID=UPI00217CC93C|nr:sugar phosphate nucleotidyltransferase [Halanaeroarchaeum sp. HSR-CO]UWG48106.1 N-acetylglucosamine-1-phosphate uridyltransferase [Halanaeroarchaeum sp. HSR-CO]